ncbi:hypothetical protein HanPI659440_Chr09g0359621 [Helianthus annuus]|nr:hypothetical protein HanPI659440_Chr09g0359621 [Helianthus annuus]
MDKESLADMTSRFYHLLTELGNFGVVTTPAEVVKKFADALPPQWNSFLEILKYNGVLATTHINDFVQLLENKDQEETLKAKRVPVPQNPEMYYGTSSTSSARPFVPHNPEMYYGTSSTSSAKSIVPCNPEMYYGTSSSSSARPGSHAPLQTAFVTSTDLYGNPIQAPVKPAPTTDLYGNPLPPVASQCHLSTKAPSSPDPRNSSQTKTAFYAEIVKDVSNGESLGGNDSSEHNSSSDEDVSTSVEGDTTSSSSEDGSECESSRGIINSDAERPTPESDSSQVCVDEPTDVNCDNCDSLRVKCADLEVNMSELQGKHDALQASLFDLQDKHVSLNAKWCELQSKHEALQEKYDVTFIHNQKLTVDLSKCTEANMFYENHEKEFKSVIEKLKKDKTELTKKVSRKQTDINLYISRLEIMQKEMACVKTESEAIQLKLDSYLSSSYVLDHIIDVQKEKRDVTCIGYKKCPPPVRHNYDAMPDEEDRTFFEPSVPLDVKEFATGLGYKKEVSSDSDVSADTCVSSAELNQDHPVIIEDVDSSDDESDDAIPAKSDAVVKDEDIPLENYILCDPPAKPAKTVAVESSFVNESESVNLLYTLVEC